MSRRRNWWHVFLGFATITVLSFVGISLVFTLLVACFATARAAWRLI